jgi:hypothetical protein
MFAIDDSKKLRRPCAICGSMDSKLLYIGDRYSLNVNTSICRSCGFIFTNPIESESFYNNFYQNEYRKFYKKKLHNPSPEYVEFFNLKGRADHHLDWISQIVELKEVENILDVGSAEGTLLNSFKSRFPHLKPVGIELDRNFAIYSRGTGLDVFDSIDDLPSLNGTTIVCLSHVLEHIYDLQSFFSQMKSKINGAIYFYVSVPDVSRYRSIKDLHIAHIYHFSIHSLNHLVGKYNFKILSIEPHSPPSLPDSIRLLARHESNEKPQLICNYDDSGKSFFFNLEKVKRQNEQQNFQGKGFLTSRRLAIQNLFWEYLYLKR